MPGIGSINLEINFESLRILREQELFCMDPHKQFCTTAQPVSHTQCHIHSVSIKKNHIESKQWSSLIDQAFLISGRGLACEQQKTSNLIGF